MHLLLTDASVTNGLVNLATHVINDIGLAGVAAMIFMSALVFVPGTEAPMLFAGFSVYQGHLSLLGIIIAGIVGDLLGASVAYAIGYFGAHEALASKGILHLDDRKLARVTDWFDRYGAPSVAVSRCLPLIRAAGPYAAGIAQMPYPRFIISAFCGTAVWITGLAFLGRGVGADWTKWKSHLDYVDYAVVVIVVVIAAWYGFRWLRARRSTEAAGA
jgi:membrane protein DedA with SNARE-associated domain